MVGDKLGDSSGVMVGEGKLDKSQNQRMAERLVKRLDKKLGKVLR